MSLKIWVIAYLGFSSSRYFLIFTSSWVQEFFSLIFFAFFLGTRPPSFSFLRGGGHTWVRVIVPSFPTTQWADSQRMQCIDAFVMDLFGHEIKPADT